MTEQTSTVASTDNALVVETFLNALQNQDFDTFENLLHVDIVYQNVGAPTVRGRTRVMKMMRGMEGKMGFEVKFHRNVADGATVINERTDAMTFGPVRVQFWVCGVFEVHDGRITLWRDYFDYLELFKAAVRGLVAVAIPRLRATMP
jgi:limonene-1,2-epoxide hydrolase